MKFVFIYGSPAVGKLTVANELSKLINFNVFHNHLTFDLAKNLFNYGTPEFEKYRDKLRYEFIEMAAKNKSNLIFTFCFAPCDYDKIFVKKIIKIVKKYNGKIYFVYLTADKKELEKRVKNESRKRYHKIKKVNLLRKILKEFNNFPSMPFVDSLKINNTNLPPKKVALMIKKHYKL